MIETFVDRIQEFTISTFKVQVIWHESEIKSAPKNGL